MAQPRKAFIIALVLAACSPRDRSTANDSIALVARGRAALPSDTAGPMHVAFFHRDSAGAVVGFEVTPPAGTGVLGGGITVRVPIHGVASVVTRGR